jgi:hypothetical protein
MSDSLFNLARVRYRLLQYVLELTERFPAEDPHGLTTRLRRAISSIPTQQRHTERALSSTAESRYLVSMCRRLGYASEEELAPATQALSAIRTKLSRPRTERAA